MNIFYLDRCPVLAAEAQCDKHVTKMIVESAQMLSAAHRLCGGSDSPILYKLTHTGHPCSKWARASRSNYCWLLDHFLALCREYTRRYTKTHATQTKLSQVLMSVPEGITVSGPTAPALAMPEEFRSDDPVVSYRRYYISKATSMTMTWKSQPPVWFAV